MNETTPTRPALPVAQQPRGLTTFAREYKLQLSIIGILVILYAIFMIGNPMVFTHFIIYRSFMTTMPFFGIMALAATYVITLGEIDLSFPSVLGFSSWVFSTAFEGTNSLALAVVLCLLTGLIAGYLNGLIVTRIGVPSIVATIGTMFLWRGLVNVMSQGKGIALVALRDSPLYPLFVGRLFDAIPAQFIWFTVLAIGFSAVYRRHRYGSHLLYVGDNEESARMMGINVDRVKIIAFMQMGFFAALAGIFLAAEVTYFWPTQGDGMLLTTLAAVFVGGTSVFGGTGTVFGTFIGVIIIGSLEAGIISIGLTGFWVQFLIGVLITISVSVYALMLRRAR